MMRIQFTDYNGADVVLSNNYSTEWAEIQSSLQALPLHLKASDQAGIQGTPIFDPVGTNKYIKADLVRKGWIPNIRIPTEFKFLGSNIDFGKSGMLVEVQFSNYPFLLNNAIRSELFHKSGFVIAGRQMEIAVFIVKAHMFPCSNSTLYYEQAVKQLDSLVVHHVFDVPMRLIGLFENEGQNIPATWTEYSNPRYSREVTSRRNLTCSINIPPGRGRIADITLI
jgi:hypothetical protein